MRLIVGANGVQPNMLMVMGFVRRNERLTHDVRKFFVETPDDMPIFIQQRAYTSPTWYRPRSSE